MSSADWEAVGGGKGGNEDAEKIPFSPFLHNFCRRFVMCDCSLIYCPADCWVTNVSCPEDSECANCKAMFEEEDEEEDEGDRAKCNRMMKMWIYLRIILFYRNYFQSTWLNSFRLDAGPHIIPEELPIGRREIERKTRLISMFQLNTLRSIVHDSPIDCGLWSHSRRIFCSSALCDVVSIVGVCFRIMWRGNHSSNLQSVADSSTRISWSIDAIPLICISRSIFVEISTDKEIRRASRGGRNYQFTIANDTDQRVNCLDKA